MNLKFLCSCATLCLLSLGNLQGGNTDWPLGPHDNEGTHCQSSEKLLSAENADKLNFKWFKGSSAVLASPTIYGNKVFYGDSQGMIHCVYAEDGAESWSTKIGTKNIMTSPAIIDDTLFTTCPVNITPTLPTTKEMSHLLAVKRKSGKMNWKTYAEGGNLIPQFEHTPMPADDLILLGSSSREAFESKNNYTFEGAVYAFDAESGFLKWRFLLTDKVSGDGAGAGVCSSVSTDPKLGYAYVIAGHAYEEPASEHSSALICLNYRTDKRDGEKVWAYQFDNKAIWSGKKTQGSFWGIKGMPLIFKGGSKKLVGISDNQYTFHALDREDGEWIWSTSLLPQGDIPFVLGPSGAAYDEDAIYAAANSLKSNSFSTQHLLQPLTKEKESALLNTLTHQVKSTVTALKPKSGAILWQKSFDSAVLGVPSVANRLVFIGFFNGYFRILDAKSGNTLYEFRTGPASGIYGQAQYNMNIPLTSTPVISEGRVFVAGGYVFPQDPTKIVPGGLFTFEAPPKEIN